jgi:hypothetical protein
LDHAEVEEKESQKNSSAEAAQLAGKISLGRRRGDKIQEALRLARESGREGRELVDPEKWPE